ncbi:hypothetical protein OUZ56_001451 [Daphnia magna]|uniref:Uncharacterized protein n=1 Tax=Daphnia magna TaxID=35525 RepID=A0ABR0A2P3_9CRUS|nr:hypothetical protein OUZ56_001451 [Daphnia magna]
MPVKIVCRSQDSKFWSSSPCPSPILRLVVAPPSSRGRPAFFSWSPRLHPSPHGQLVFASSVTPSSPRCPQNPGGTRLRQQGRLQR